MPEDKLTAGEHAALGLWAVWFLTTSGGGNRAAIETRSAWHLRELVAELADVARAKGRQLEIPDPLFFRDVLEALVDLEVAPAEFFDGVIRRWTGGSSHGSN